MIGALSNDYLTRLEAFRQKELVKQSIMNFSGCSDEVADRLSQEEDKHKLIESVVEYFLKNQNHAEHG